MRGQRGGIRDHRVGVRGQEGEIRIHIESEIIGMRSGVIDQRDGLSNQRKKMEYYYSQETAIFPLEISVPCML